MKPIPAAAERKAIKVADLRAFDPLDCIRHPRELAKYLSALMESGNAGDVAAALGDLCRARGMTGVAEAAGLGRESLYKALRPGASPRLETAHRVLSAMGLRLAVVPAGSTE